jgi:hypothetical protein
MEIENNNLQEHLALRDREPNVQIYSCEEYSRSDMMDSLPVKVEIDDSELLIWEVFEALYPHLTSDYDKFEEFKRSNVVKFNWIFLSHIQYLLRVPEDDLLYMVKSSRNRDIITAEEQEKLRHLSIGIVGLSVGQSSALTLAQSGVGEHFKLADPDKLAYSNVGRIPVGGIKDIGRLKTYIAGEAMLDKNSYLKIEYYNEAITKENMRKFLEGLDYVVDAFDSIQAKITLRRIAKELGITVVMGTDIEYGARIDIEGPEDHIFLGSLSEEELSEIENMEDIPKNMRNIIIPKILGFKSIDELPFRLRRHLESMKDGNIPWMSQLAIASSQVGGLVTRVIVDSTLDGIQSVERRQKTELTGI